MMKKNEEMMQKSEKKEEKQITSWHCDTYCRNVRHVSCEGENGIDPDSPNRCPFLDEMLY